MRLIALGAVVSLLAWAQFSYAQNPCSDYCRGDVCKQRTGSACICSEAFLNCVNKTCPLFQQPALDNIKTTCASSTSRPTTTSSPPVVSPHPSNVPATPSASSTTSLVPTADGPSTSPSTADVLSTSRLSNTVVNIATPTTNTLQIIPSINRSNLPTSLPQNQDTDTTLRQPALFSYTSPITPSHTDTGILGTPGGATSQDIPTGNNNTNKSNAGAIAGGVIGGLLGLGVLAAIVVLAMRRAREARRERETVEELQRAVTAPAVMPDDEEMYGYGYGAGTPIEYPNDKAHPVNLSGGYTETEEYQPPYSGYGYGYPDEKVRYP